MGFAVHLIISTVATAAGIAASLWFDWAGELRLFIPVLVTANLAGYLANRVTRGRGAMWVWPPMVLWFAFNLIGKNYYYVSFQTQFIGSGTCSDLNCWAQVVVTAPLVGAIAYSIAARLAR